MSRGLRLNQIFDLKGKVAFVTGGGTGIGYDIAEGLATNGAKVYIGGRRREALDKAAQELSRHNLAVIPIVADVTDRESILQARKVIEDADGVLHILVNNAGQVGPKSDFLRDKGAPERANPEALGMALFKSETPEQWVKLYEGNAGYSPVVINITSVSGITKLSQRHFAYNSSKAAAAHLTRMMATEFVFKDVPVRVNAIAPGVYPSEMTEATIEGAELVDKIGDTVIPVPAGRAGKPEEIVGTVIYLASPAGFYTNGQEIVVDGGYLAVNPSSR